MDAEDAALRRHRAIASRCQCLLAPQPPAPPASDHGPDLGFGVDRQLVDVTVPLYTL